MKALIVTTVSGFLSQFEMNCVFLLQKNGFEVHYASNFNNRIYEFDQKALDDAGVICHNIDIAKSPLDSKHNRSAFKQLKELINEYQFDLVHCHNPVGGVLSRRAASISSADPVVIYTAHGFHFYNGQKWIANRLFHGIERHYAHMTDIIVTINQEDYLAARQFKLKPDGMVYRTHGVGVDSNRFHPDKEVGMEVRKELGIPADAFHIVTAAELNDNKNQKTVIEAVAKYDNRKIYYSICGKGYNQGKLQQLIDSLGLSERVKLLGYRSDMNRVLNSADCFAFPSIREGLGIAALEALFTGVPLIVADNRGTREYSWDHRNSLVCNAASSDEFAYAIKKLYEDRDLLNEMSDFSRESVALFSLERNDFIMDKIYKKALEMINGRAHA